MGAASSLLYLHVSKHILLRMRNYRVPGSSILPIGGLYRLPIFSEAIQFGEIDKSRLKVKQSH